MTTYLIFSLILFFVGPACSPDEVPILPQMPIEELKEKTFLALGDSYTIGESVDPTLRWPVQLADSLNLRGIQFAEPHIIAKTGWTTGELIRAIEQASDLQEEYDLVSLLIGVNNQYRQYEFAVYRTEFPKLLGTALEFAGGDTSKVIVLSIPDYGVTPFGQNRNAAQIASELDQYNVFASERCEELGIRFFDITPISREAKEEPELVARDGLHPSGLMYKRWVELIYDSVAEKIE